MKTLRSLVPALVLATSVFAGCAAETAAPTETTQDGLTLSVNTSDRVVGELRGHGATILFESVKSGEASHVTVTSSDGTELIRLESDVEKTTTSILDRRLVVVAPREGSAVTQSVTGDVQAAEQIKARPDFELVKELSTALAAAGVSDDLSAPLAGEKRINQVDPDRAPLPEGTTGGGGGGGGKKCSTWEKIGCVAWITTCSGACAAATGGVTLAECIAACVATTAAGCLKCL